MGVPDGNTFKCHVPTYGLEQTNPVRQNLFNACSLTYASFDEHETDVKKCQSFEHETKLITPKKKKT